jgi:hypothetical protein
MHRTRYRRCSVHRVLADWGKEAPCRAGVGAPAATTGDATWLHRFYPALLASAGGDYDPVQHASAVVGGVGFYACGDALTADVSSWWNSPSGNFGWLFVGNETGVNHPSLRISRGQRSRTASPPCRPFLGATPSRPRPGGGSRACIPARRSRRPGARKKLKEYYRKRLFTPLCSS